LGVALDKRLPGGMAGPLTHADSSSESSAPAPIACARFRDAKMGR